MKWLLVAYDIRTDSPAARRRLRRVARCCLDYGHRVQRSVYECRLSEARWRRFRRRLLELCDPGEDCLVIYALPPGATVELSVGTLPRRPGDPMIF